MTALGDEIEEIAKLVREIMERDRASPGYALMVARGLIAEMPNDDALAVIGQQPKAKSKSPPISVDALIG
jgi:hypothetical protein